MAYASLIACPDCGGTGLVARAVPPLAEGEHVRRDLNDRMPFFGQELCSKCGGGGKIKGTINIEEKPRSDTGCG